MRNLTDLHKTISGFTEGLLLLFFQYLDIKNKKNELFVTINL